MNPTSEATRLLRALLSYFVLFAAFALMALRLPVNDNVLPPFLSAWIGACVGIALVYLFSRGPDDNWTLWKVIAGGMAVDLLFNYAAIQLFVDSEYFLSEKFMAVLLEDNADFQAALFSVGNLGVLSAAIGIGLLVARGLKQPRYLIMAAIVGAVTDIISVYFGPSKLILGSETFPYVAYHWGLIGQGGVHPCVGAGDFIFLALYFAGARRFALNTRKTFVAMCAAFALGFLTLLLSPTGIPALPFMAVLLLLVHGRELWSQSKEPDTA